eukprot:SAG11_NODE_298_length_11076_cov_4.253621_7_plen_64_part_00
MEELSAAVLDVWVASFSATATVGMKSRTKATIGPGRCTMGEDLDKDTMFERFAAFILAENCVC